MKKLLLISSLFITSLFGDVLKNKMMVNVTLSGVSLDEASFVGGQYQIDDKGYLKIPYMEAPIKLSGSSSTSAAKKLADYFKKKEIYTTPVFTVTSFKNADQEEAYRNSIARAREESERKRTELREEKKVVFVKGFAVTPGKMRHTHNMTLATLLAECGGDNDYGSNRRVIILRNGVSREYNYHDNPAYHNMKMVPGDIVEIPEGKGFSGKK